MRFTTRQIVNCGILIAMSIILTRFTSFLIAPYIRVGFGPIPIYMAGIIMGPVAGGIVGGLADLVGFWFNTFGFAFPNPFIFLASILRGVIPALMLMLLNRNKITVFKMTAAVTVTEIVAGLLVTTYGLVFIFGTPFWVMFTPRLIATIIQVPVYVSFVYLPLVRLKSAAVGVLRSKY